MPTFHWFSTYPFPSFPFPNYPTFLLPSPYTPPVPSVVPSIPRSLSTFPPSFPLYHPLSSQPSSFPLNLPLSLPTFLFLTFPLPYLSLCLPISFPTYLLTYLSLSQPFHFNFHFHFLHEKKEFYTPLENVILEFEFALKVDGILSVGLKKKTLRRAYFFIKFSRKLAIFGTMYIPVRQRGPWQNCLYAKWHHFGII